MREFLRIVRCETSPKTETTSKTKEKAKRLPKRKDSPLFSLRLTRKELERLELEAKGNRLYWDYDNHMRGEAYFLIGSELYDWFASFQPSKKNP